MWLSQPVRLGTDQLPFVRPYRIFKEQRSPYFAKHVPIPMNEMFNRGPGPEPETEQYPFDHLHGFYIKNKGTNSRPHSKPNRHLNNRS